MPDYNVIRSALRDAILRTWDETPSLISMNAHERAVMFRIGFHFGSLIESASPGLHVDLEYNRLGGADPKRVQLEKTDGRKADLVIPDLILHRREQNDWVANLLIVEAKKGDSRGRELSRAQEKLAGYKSEFHYQHAVLLYIAQNPLWQWIGEEEGRRPVE